MRKLVSIMMKPWDWEVEEVVREEERLAEVEASESEVRVVARRVG